MNGCANYLSELAQNWRTRFAPIKLCALRKKHWRKRRAECVFQSAHYWRIGTKLNARAAAVAGDGGMPGLSRVACINAGTVALIEIEVAEQGGMIAAMDGNDVCAATGMRRPALVAALSELSAAGFIVTSMRGRFCIVALSSAWRGEHQLLSTRHAGDRDCAVASIIVVH